MVGAKGLYLTLLQCETDTEVIFGLNLIIL